MTNNNLAIMRNPIIENDLKFITGSRLPWDQFKGKTVLVTGANGFIPAYMVETLLYLNEKKSYNIKVIALVRNIDKARTRFSAYLGREDLVFVEQDIGYPLKMDTSADIIIHAASQASPKFYGTDPVGTLRPNVIGTANLLDFARSSGAENFLFFSSSEVYGEVAASMMPIPENVYGWVDPVSVRSCYAESKRMGETMCASWHHQYGVPAKIVRPFHTYGPKMQLDDGRVYADFISDILNNKDITLKSDGSASRAFCYLADAVLGFFTVMLKGKNGEAYNIGNTDAETSILDLAESLVKLFPEKGLKIIRQERASNNEYLQSKISRASPAIEKARSLGWEPATGIEEGFMKTIRSFHEFK